MLGTREIKSAVVPAVSVESCSRTNLPDDVLTLVRPHYGGEFDVTAYNGGTNPHKLTIAGAASALEVGPGETADLKVKTK